MQRLTEIAFGKAPHSPFTRAEVACWVGGSSDCQFNLVKRALASGEILHLRRGLYYLASRFQREKADPLPLAQRIHGPSYVSLESALSYHGWIPEAVYAITSACMDRARDFDTPLGHFAFITVPQKIFYTQVTRAERRPGQSFLLAAPLKALADYVYVHKLDWRSIHPVIESLRVDEQALQNIDRGTIDELLDNYTSLRVRRFLKGLRKGSQAMSVKLIQDRLDGYACQSALEEEQALREISQEIVLAALGRTDFYQKAAFQGGTCLRIFYGLQRFSEDLDFALQSPNSNFVLGPYLDALTRELKAYGYQLEIDDRSQVEKAVRIAFLKDDSLGNLLQLHFKPASGPARKLRIKLEVDANPPSGAAFETKYLDFPFASAACVFDLPSLFAGKLHALLCRQYLKGRDWYDFIWYTARKAPVNYALLAASLRQTGPWKDQPLLIDRAWCVTQLRTRIEAIDWRQAREDVRRFLKPHEYPSLELWEKPLFLAQAEKLF